jgi:cytochrome c oxidase subunit IV
VADQKAHGEAQHREHHEHGLGRYVVIWLALLVLTVVTVVTGKIDLGAANIYVAMLIACTKATLVVLFFMHLLDTGNVNKLIFVVSVIFSVVLVIGVFGDLLRRYTYALPGHGPAAPVEVAPAAPGSGGH